jgi:hypothetical protein
MNNLFRFKIGWCPFCDQGWAQIQKDPAVGDLIVVCSECDTVWSSPEHFKNGIPIKGYQFKTRVFAPHWDEIINKGWSRFLLDEQDLGKDMLE